MADNAREIAPAEVLDLLERAAFDLEHGWPEAALDNLARALRLLEAQRTVGRGGELGGAPQDAHAERSGHLMFF